MVRIINPIRRRRLGPDRKGIAAVEFALIAPALIVLFMGVIELTFRFHASQEATRYVHQAADLIAREHGMTTGDLDAIYDASVHMMKPLDTTSNLDMDVVAIALEDDGSGGIDKRVLWRRTAGAGVPYDLNDITGLGQVDESVIRVGIRYKYTSPVSTLFGGPNVNFERESFSRPRALRYIKMDGQEDHNGATATFGN